MAIIYTLSRL